MNSVFPVPSSTHLKPALRQTETVPISLQNVHQPRDLATGGDGVKQPEMATKKTPASESWRSPVDWQHQSHHRVMSLWHVVAMSLGVAPSKPSLKLAREHEEFEKAYVARSKTLGMKLSSQPLDEHVTYFPDHEYNKRGRFTKSRMVDVVSCILVLETIYPGELPEEFIALKDPLSKLSLPNEHSSLTDVVVMPGAAPVTAPLPSEKPKKSQVNRNNSVEHNSLLVLIYAMAKCGYCFEADGNLSHQDKENLENIYADVLRVTLKGYGLSDSKIRQYINAGKSLVNKDE